MTWFAWARRTSPEPRFTQPLVPSTPPPKAPLLAEISVVVPVRDNAAGILRLLSWWSRLGPHERPQELVIVDDGSLTPVAAAGDGVRVLRIPPSGPASARNVGWRSLATDWCAFLDSDCLPERGWPGRFGDGWMGEIALQGGVRAMGSDPLSHFYETQKTLEPMFWSADGRPQYLITANALVHRAALAHVGGFDTRFPLAGGEDVDLGLRLSRVGNLRWCPTAIVAHDFEPTVQGLFRRFFRYGRGNRMLEKTGGVTGQFRPRPFLPNGLTAVSLGLAVLAFLALTAGWVVEAMAPAAPKSGGGGDGGSEGEPEKVRR